ncbi:response regulator transcription factor [Xanthomonas sp. XNM01]|uniref:response regulator n=1 Tax=Xanthomonas sp. XNM01 TaxID=2769289 RepID=UPI001782E5EE|nr:response regulator transcription factor [Xanthomonas sp. XNM01]MBD9370068.1 response regulator transcription factor [Xanthomonas sp. XNM01]
MNESLHPIGVMTVDDHPLLRDGLAAMLARQTDMRLVGEAGDGAEAVTRYDALRPDVVLMDLQMPRMDGVEATARIRQLDPRARIIVLTTYKGDVRALRALQAGASNYLLKDMLRRDLVDTIRNVHAGRRQPMPPEVAESLAAHVLDEPLSQRETEVLQQVAAGLSNKQVGQRLLVSEETVKAHMKSILSKLKARDRTHAVTKALRRGILMLEE